MRKFGSSPACDFYSSAMSLSSITMNMPSSVKELAGEGPTQQVYTTVSFFVNVFLFSPESP